MVKVQRNRRSEPAPSPTPESHHVRDIGGLSLIFASLACLICLIWRQGAPIPDLVDWLLRLFAGVGAYAVPPLLGFVGVMMLAGYRRWSFSHSSFGSLLLFLVFVTWRHLAQAPDPAHPESAQVLSAGGWIGGLFGAFLVLLFQKSISYLILVTLALIAAVLLVDQPIAEIARRTAAKAQAAREQVARVAARMPDATGSRPKGTKPLALETAGSDQERAARAARVVERALVASKPSAKAPVEPEPEEDDDAPVTRSRFANLFNLHRRPFRESVAEGETDHLAEEIIDPTVPENGTGSTLDAAEIETNGSKPPRKTRGKGSIVAELKAGKEAGGEEHGQNGEAGSVPKPDAALPILLFALPPLTLLQEAPASTSKRTQEELTDNVSIIERTLEQFNIGASVMEVASGPSVTRYEVQLAPGIKVSKIVSLADNLAMSLAAIDVRVEAPIPGKAAIGVEVPNATPSTVTLRECLETEEFRKAPSMLTIALGKDVSGQFRYADLCKMPHLLIGGSTNSGKSVCLNALIASLVYRATPREVRLLMIDPKRVELSLWDGIPHLMHPVVKDVKQAAGIFRAAIKEMDRRYDLFAALGTRNLDGYNARVPESERLPYLVLIVDELADLMMQQGPEVETSICRLAQLARATGIHLVIATQRPSVDIITGTIKANIASRIAFAVASQVDSRTILDMTGADRLIGRGDMLFMPIDAAKPIRIQGAYLSENETNAIVDYLKAQEKPTYTFSVADGGASGAAGSSAGADDDVDDQFFEQAVRLVVNNGQASTSMLQRRFRIGYTRAARIVEMMEERGIVGPLNGAKPRELLVSKDDVEQMFNPGGALPSVADYEDDE